MVQHNKVGLQAEYVTLQEQTLTDEQKGSDGLTVTGLALPFGEESRNGVIYEEESVREAADTMIGTSVLFNHDPDEPVGFVEDVKVHEDGLSYRMNLNPDHELVDSVERGDISNVSIQALVDPVEGDTNKVEVVEFLELSLVTIPGFKQTDVEVEEVGTVPEGVMAVESFVDEFEGKESDDSVSNPDNNKILGDLNMEKIKEQLSADEVDSLIELVNIHNEALKEDIVQYIEENDLIEDEDEPEEPEEEPEDEEKCDDDDMDDDEEEESKEDSDVEEESADEEYDSKDDEEEEEESEDVEGDEETEEESVEDEPVDPVAEEMDKDSEDIDFKATIPRISR